MPKRPISYTSRDFESIKASLVNYAKRYYANTYQDFNEASFGAMMLDMVSYIGDQLSFYTDYQANESFLDTAIEIENVSRLAKQLGYHPTGAPSSTGPCNFYVLVPASTTIGGPDSDYIPILKRGTIVSGEGGGVFTLLQDVDFTAANNEITVARVDSDTGVPTFFAIKGQGLVASGQTYTENMEVGDYQRFLRLGMKAENVTEIISIVDTQGNEYYQVDFLTQDVVMLKEPNRGTNRNLVPFIMKTKPVPRRFVTEFNTNGDASIQFGYGSSDNLTGDLIADPADVVLSVTGREYVSDTTFDPTNLIKSDKFGVVPENTTLTIRYRANTTDNVSAPIGTVTTVVLPLFTFANRNDLAAGKVSEIQGSLEVENFAPILGDTSDPTVEEIRTRAYASFASQNRAVTRTDYISLAYRMPSGFGKIKRANITQDPRSNKRNLNMYILSENTNGDFTQATTQLKNNLKIWLNRYRMMNDTIDILDGKVINFGVSFEVIVDLNSNRFEVLNACTRKLIDKVFNVKKELGEPVYLTDIYKHLNSVAGVVDTVSVELTNKTGGGYSEFRYDMQKNLSDDGRFLIVPPDAVADVLNPENDITGVVR
jgi:hypothetical protein